MNYNIETLTTFALFTKVKYTLDRELEKKAKNGTKHIWKIRYIVISKLKRKKPQWSIPIAMSTPVPRFWFLILSKEGIGHHGGMALLGMRQEIYKMIINHLVVPGNKEVKNKSKQ